MTESGEKSLQPAGKHQSDYLRLVHLLTRYAHPYWRQIVLLVMANLGVALLVMLNPLILAPILDVALGRVGQSATAPAPGLSQLNLENLGAVMLHVIGVDVRQNAFFVIIMLALVYFTVNALAELLRFCGYLLALSIRIHSARDLQAEMYRHVLAMPMGFFVRHRTGDLVSRLENDTAATTYGFEGIIGPAITSVLLVAFYGTLLVRTNPRLTLAAVVAAGLHYLISKALQGPLRAKVREQFAALGNVTAVMQEALLSIRVVKSFAAERFELDKFRSSVASLLRANMRFGFFKNVEQPLRSVTDRLIDVGILLPAAYELLHGRLTAASFFLFLYVVRAMVQPINALGQVLTTINTMLASSERVFEVLDQHIEVADGPDVPARLADAIEFERVSFGYGSVPVIANVSFRIARGERVAFVGPSGAGKSTMFDLVLRFYDPGSGRVLFDGVDIRRFRQDRYRAHFGVVAQESLLFNATVRENIAYGRADVSQDDIEQAAKIANAHEFIAELSDGYGTLVGDRGIRLSGGQRQRIGIARAIVGRPDILLLDEATSALDSENERQVQDAIDRVTASTTSLIIAHRLSTVLHANRIVVMNRGMVEAIGSHDELLRHSPTYRTLYKLQFTVPEPARALEANV